MNTNTNDATHDRTQFLGGGQVRISFTADVDFLGTLQRCRELMRHDCPEGRLEDVISEALLVFLDLEGEDWESEALDQISSA